MPGLSGVPERGSHTGRTPGRFWGDARGGQALQGGRLWRGVAGVVLAHSGLGRLADGEWLSPIRWTDTVRAIIGPLRHPAPAHCPMQPNHIPPAIAKKFEVHEWKHATAILKSDFPDQWQDILDLLSQFRICKSWITVGGGRKSKVADAVDSFLFQRGWVEKEFATSVKVDDNNYQSPTHKVDCYKDRVALEVEWNNKDPFFDRDLNNFRLLFDLRAISVGVIITRCDELQDVFESLGRGTSYGASTTHMSKLLPRIEGGGGAGCPLLVVGLRKELYNEKC